MFGLDLATCIQACIQHCGATGQELANMIRTMLN